MRKFAVLLVLCLLGGNVFAACITRDSEDEVTAYFYPATATRITPNLESGEPPYDLEAQYNDCATSLTQWYLDTTNRVYRRVKTCTSCPSGWNLVQRGGAIGECWADIDICSYCSESASPKTNYQQATTYTASNCSSTSINYVNIDVASAYFKITSCTACQSGYHMASYNTSFSGCPVNANTCVKCGSGSYFNEFSGSWNRCVGCPKGTYNPSNQEVTECTPCPEVMGLPTTTSSTGASSVTSCCVDPDNSTGSDAKGDYRVVSPSTCCATN